MSTFLLKLSTFLFFSEQKSCFFCAKNRKNRAVHIFTCLLSVLSNIWIQCGLGNITTLYYILFVRIISRTIGIILSFVLAVISGKNKKSNLRFSKRCLLAIISLFEVLMLSFVVFYVVVIVEW